MNLRVTPNNRHHPRYQVFSKQTKSINAPLFTSVNDWDLDARLRMHACNHLQQTSTKVSLASYAARAVSAISIVTPDPCHCVCVCARSRVCACAWAVRLARAGEKDGAQRTLDVQDMLEHASWAGHAHAKTLAKHMHAFAYAEKGETDSIAVGGGVKLSGLGVVGV